MKQKFECIPIYAKTIKIVDKKYVFSALFLEIVHVNIFS